MRSSNQLLFLSFSFSLDFCISVSFGFYMSNQFPEFSLFVYFWKSPMKIRNVLFILFYRFVCFCCHQSPLINFSVKFWKLQSIYDLFLLQLNVSLRLHLIKRHSVTPFPFPHSGFCMICFIVVYFIQITDILWSAFILCS